MITTVTGKNQITIPAKLARSLEIQPGTRLDWSIGAHGELVGHIILERGALARKTAGMAQQWLDEGADPVGDLIRERIEDDANEEAL